MIQNQEQQERVVAFIDLLGFKDAIKQPDKHKTILEVLGLFKKNEKFSFEQIDVCANFDPSFVLPTISVFSDSIILSYPVDNNLCILRCLAQLDSKIIELAMFALERGFLIRGGISKGMLYHSNGIVFGQALIDAYELESKSAIYPRVIFSKSMVDEYDILSIDVGNNQHVVDIDGMCMLNYIRPMFQFLVMGVQLNKFEKIINETISDLRKRNLLQPLSKWIWLQHHFKALKDSKHGASMLNDWKQDNSDIA